jgi:hypothetical protein
MIHLGEIFRSTIRGFTAVIVLFLVVGESVAQEKREPPPRKAEILQDTVSHVPTTKLPSIDLPEYVITGKETIDLPRSSKRSTDPQTEEALLDRNDLMGKRDNAFTPDPRPLPEAVFAPGRDVLDGKVSIGYGSYRTPFFDGWFGHTSGVSGFLLKAGYVSSAGHLPQADYRKGYSALSGTTTLPDGTDLIGSARVQGRLGLDGHSYHLYGSANPALERTKGGLTCDVGVQATTADLFEYGLKASLQSASQVDKTSARETALGLELNGSRTLRGVDLRGDVNIWTDIYSASVPVQNPNFLEFGLSARRQFSEVWDISGGIVFSAYRGSDTEGIAKLYPRVRALMHATPSLMFFAAFEPGVTRVGLSSMIQENPYLANTVQIRHLDRSIHASMGAEANIGRAVRARLALSVERARDLPLYVDPGSTGTWSVDYLGVTDIVSFDGEVYADVGDGDHASGSISAKSVRNSITGLTVPYIPALQITGLYQHRFPIGITVGGILKVVSQHYVDLQCTRALGPRTLVDLRGDYVVVRNLTATLMVNNLFNGNQTWWDRYEGLGRTVSFMMGFTW